MNKYVVVPILMLTLAALNKTAGGEAMPMLDRHIFTPDASAAVAGKGDAARLAVMTDATIEKKLSFTGVMITPKEKLAILSEAGNRKDAKSERIYKEGEQIDGMTIKEIGPNYLTMASKDKTVRLDLYKSIKARPAQIPAGEPQQASMTTADAGKQSKSPANGTAGNMPPGGKTGDGAKNNQQPSPFGYGGQKSPSTTNSGGGGSSNAASKSIMNLLNSAAAARNGAGGAALNPNAFPLTNSTSK